MPLKTRLVPLSSYLTRNLRYCPLPRSNATAKSTRNISSDEIAFDATHRLDAVVSCQNLVDQLIQDAIFLADTVVVDDDKHAAWLASLNPHGTQYLGTPVINSEGDSGTWSQDSFFRPALSALRACHDGMPLEVGGDPGEATLWMSTSENVGRLPLPDGQFACSRWTRGGFIDIRMIYENKTGNAMPGNTFAKIHNIKDYNGRRVAIPFLWPTSNKGVDKPTRILAQVCQPSLLRSRS